MEKRLLLISSDFFAYYRHIQREMEKQGWKVDYISDRPSSSPFIKIAIRKFRFLIEPYLTYFYLKKLKTRNGNGRYDAVVVIKGEGITARVLTEIKKRYCSGRMILYFWDGIANIPGAKANSKVVDKVFTFDSKDADDFGFTLLPLFFVKRAVESASTRPIWDLSFVGSIHGDRMKVISQVRKAVASWAKVYVFIYFGSSLLFFFRKFFDRSFGDFAASELSQVPMSKVDAENIFLQSIAVLDINHKSQTGLTMRTMEALSLGKKLITTNSYIRKYPFYDESQVMVIDRKNPTINRIFFDAPISSDFAEKLAPYEISQWVRRLLST